MTTMTTTIPRRQGRFRDDEDHEDSATPMTIPRCPRPFHDDSTTIARQRRRFGDKKTPRRQRFDDDDSATMTNPQQRLHNNNGDDGFLLSREAGFNGGMMDIVCIEATCNTSLEHELLLQLHLEFFCGAG